MAQRRGNILMEFVAAYGLQMLLAAGVLSLAVIAYNMVTASSAASEIRTLHSAIQSSYRQHGYIGLTSEKLAKKVTSRRSRLLTARVFSFPPSVFLSTSSRVVVPVFRLLPVPPSKLPPPISR